MRLTEQEARMTWCPFARVGGANRPPVSGACNCIASRCSQWRWADPAFDFTYRVPNNPPGKGWDELKTSEDDGDGEIVTWRRPWPSRTGYCGLSGPRPQHG
jgi:hypothetical protein